MRHTTTQSRLASSLTFLATVLPLASYGAHTWADDLYFPTDSWETVSPDEVGWDAQKLNAAIDFAMQRKSSSVVILHGGRILAERHAKVSKPSRRYSRMLVGETDAGHAVEDVASVQKSVVSLLVGVAIEKGMLCLDDPVHKVLQAGWSKANQDQESKITIRHLITMTSGLNSRLKFVAEPGTKWAYNTTAYSKSLACLEKASGLSANELSAKWLLNATGMKDSKWNDRPGILLLSGSANTVGFATSARDLARFGLLIQAHGKWQERSLLSDTRYLDDALSTSQEMNPSYGYLWWLNGKESALIGRRSIPGSLLSTAPGDMVAALGALGRKCHVVPSLNLVVTRLGDTPNLGEREKFDKEFWRLLMLAAKRQNNVPEKSRMRR